MVKIVAGIVLYNPKIKRLKENITSISKQVDELIFYDNGSRNVGKICALLNEVNCKYKLLQSHKNNGIAKALNEIALYALDHNYEWLLTLDQDSICFSNIINVYKKYLDLPNVGQLTCNNKDRNLNIEYENDYKVEAIKYCITSGTLLNLKAWRRVGGFDSSMFIDRVDNEFCCALRNKGYITYKINFYGILHEMGHISTHHILNKQIIAMNYSPFRYYYIAMNSILVARRYPNEESIGDNLLHQIKLNIKILIFEKDKLNKTFAILRGIYCGMRRTKKRYIS